MRWNQIFKQWCLVAIIMILASMPAWSQDASFTSFLAQMKNVSAINVEAFGEKRYEASLDTVRYGKFLPRQEHSHSCSNTQLLWQEGGYMKMDGFIVVLLTRHCFNHHDRFEHMLMESALVDYVVATYTPEGCMIDCRSFGYDGIPYRCEMIHNNKNNSIIVEQSELADSSQMYKYEDFLFLSRRHRYTIDKTGNIKVKAIGKERKKIVYNKDAHCDPMPFSEFLSYFERWDKPYKLDSVFQITDYGADIQSAAFYKLTSDTIDRRSLPREIMWRPCRYMETESEYHFFVIADSGRPIHGYPYSDYIKLVFTKDGVYRRAEHMGFWSEDGEKIIW